MTDFNNDMRNGEKFIGVESLNKFIEERSREFGENDCLYLNYGLKPDPKTASEGNPSESQRTDEAPSSRLDASFP